MSTYSFQSRRTRYDSTNSLFQPIRTVFGYTPHSKDVISIQFLVIKEIGRGTFASVSLVNTTVLPSKYSEEETPNEILAMKIIGLKHKHEKDVHAAISGFHRNIVQLKYYCGWVNSSNKPYIFLLMEHLPETLHNLLVRFKTRQQNIPLMIRKLFMKNILSALVYLHGQQIGHRDIKSLNILVDFERYIIKLADFGSAKIMKIGEPHSPGVGTRFYCAPELLCGNRQYGLSIDIWSAAIVFMDMINMEPLFQGSDPADQLMKIFEVLGYPNNEEKEIIGFKTDSFPMKFQENTLHTRLGLNVDDKVIDLLKNMLQYNFHKRFTAAESLSHTYFC